MYSPSRIKSLGDKVDSFLKEEGVKAKEIDSMIAKNSTTRERGYRKLSGTSTSSSLRRSVARIYGDLAAHSIAIDNQELWELYSGLSEKYAR